MRMPLQATGLALALVIEAALGSLSFPLDIGYGLMPRAANGNLQNFQGALGGLPADPITSSGDSQRPFAVAGNTFTDLSSAVERSCGNQHGACADAANAQGNGRDGKGFTVGDCDAQQTSCVAAMGSGTPTSEPASKASVFAALTGTPQSSDADFFYFCDP